MSSCRRAPPRRKVILSDIDRKEKKSESVGSREILPDPRVGRLGVRRVLALRSWAWIHWICLSEAGGR